MPVSPFPFLSLLSNLKSQIEEQGSSPNEKASSERTSKGQKEEEGIHGFRDEELTERSRRGTAAGGEGRTRRAEAKAAIFLLLFPLPRYLSTTSAKEKIEAFFFFTSSLSHPRGNLVNLPEQTTPVPLAVGPREYGRTS